MTKTPKLGLTHDELQRIYVSTDSNTTTMGLMEAVAVAQLAKARNYYEVQLVEWKTIVKEITEQ